MRSEWKTIKIKKEIYKKLVFTKSRMMEVSRDAQTGLSEVIEYLYSRAKSNKQKKETKQKE